MNDADLEHLVDGELKHLPTPPAPATLLPTVLAAAAARQRAPWYARPWLTWPFAWRLASAAVFAGVVAGFWLVVPGLLQGAGSPVAGVTGAAQQASTIARVFWRVLVEPIAVVLAVVAISLSLACAAIWTTLERWVPAGNGGGSGL